MGDPAFDRRLAFAQGLAPLPGARHEVEAIALLYQPLAALLIGGAATVPEFIDLARKSAVVHVAAHAIVSAGTPPRSLILLSPSTHDSGALNTQELITKLRQLDQTRLVILSACDTGSGAA